MMVPMCGGARVRSILAAVLCALPAAALAEPDGGALLRLEGRVTHEGRPVEGATVEVYESGVVHTALSARDGRFAFEGLPVLVRMPATGYVVTAAKGMRVATANTGWDMSGPLVARVELELVPGVALEGRVTGPKGTGIAGVELRGYAEPPVLTLAKAVGRTRTDASGHYQLFLVAGRAEVLALGDGIVPVRAIVDIPAGGRSFDLAVEPDAPIGGRVVDPEGKPVPGATISPRLKGQLLDDRTATSGSDGRFRITGLSPGDYELTGSHRELRSGKASARAPSTGARLVLARGGEVQGLAVDGAGQPLEVQVRTVQRGLPPNDRSDYGHDTRSGRDGRFRLSGLEDGRWVLEGIRPGRTAEYPQQNLRAVVLVEGGRAPEVELRFPATGTLEGQVVDERGQGLRDVSVAGHPLEADGSRSERPVLGGKSDAGGHFVLQGAVGGPYRVTADRMGYVSASGRRDVFGEEGPSAAVGAKDLRLALRRAPLVTGRLVGHDGKLPEGWEFVGMSVEVDRTTGRFRATVEGTGPIALRIRATGLAGRIFRFDKPPAADVDVGEVWLVTSLPLTGRVLGPDGAPRPGTLVSVAVGEWRDQRTADASGTFAFEVPEGTAELSVDDGDLSGSATATVGKGAVDIHLQRPANLSGLVLDGAGKPLLGAEVEARGGAARRAKAERGYFSFVRLTPGQWTLRVFRKGAREPDPDFEPISVELRAGAREMLELRAR
jgi:protocatechuate 3,4-dioxygenase beta subunit